MCISELHQEGIWFNVVGLPEMHCPLTEGFWIIHRSIGRRGMADRVYNASLTKLQDEGRIVRLDPGALAHWSSRPWMLAVVNALVADARRGEVVQQLT